MGVATGKSEHCQTLRSRRSLTRHSCLYLCVISNTKLGLVHAINVARNGCLGSGRIRRCNRREMGCKARSRREAVERDFWDLDSFCSFAITPDSGNEISPIRGQSVGTSIARVMIASANAPAVLLLPFVYLQWTESCVCDRGRVKSHDILASKSKCISAARWYGVKAKCRAHSVVVRFPPMLGQASLKINLARMRQKVAFTITIDSLLHLWLGGYEDVAADVPRGIHRQSANPRAHAIRNLECQG